MCISGITIRLLYRPPTAAAALVVAAGCSLGPVATAQQQQLDVLNSTQYNIIYTINESSEEITFTSATPSSYSPSL